MKKTKKIKEVNVFGRVDLKAEQLPKEYFNILPLLPEKLAPPLDPRTKKPLKPKALEVLFPKELIKQEVSEKRSIRIPEELQEQLLQINRR